MIRTDAFQVCYVLTGGDDGCYADMAFISASVLRRLYPQVVVSLLVDKVTESWIVQNQATRLDVFDRVVAVKTHEDNPVLRSRSIKTRMRNLIDGDFCYMDVDALPIRPFHKAFDDRPLMAAVLDRNKVHPRPRFPKWAKSHFRTMNWHMPLKRYFNSGIVFWADTELTRRVSEKWHEQWRLWHAQTGLFQDQPAFNWVIETMQVDVRVLPVCYNAMVDVSPWFARNAKILHFFLSQASATDTVFAHLLDHLKKTGQVDWIAVDRCFRFGNPWVSVDQIDRALATKQYSKAVAIIGRIARDKVCKVVLRQDIAV